jgi:hypothetical protein
MPYSPEQLATMPIEDLESLVMEESKKLSGLLDTGGEETIPADPAMEELPADVAVSPIMNPEVPLDMLSPDIIQAATSTLVAAGLLDRATGQMTPELIEVFQTAANEIAPGIYNLTNDEDLMEFVNGIANGTIAFGGIPGAGEFGVAGSPAV